MRKLLPDRRDGGPWVTPEDLNLAPALLGQPLARPGRRLAAMLIDLALIGVVAALANGWMLAGLALFGYLHWRPAGPAGRRLVLQALAVLLIAWGVWQLASEGPVRRVHVVAEAAEAGDAAAVEPAAGEAVALRALARRVKALEAQIKRANQPAPLRWRDQFVNWLDEIGLGYGWSMLYFTLLPAWWGGQTAGKRLLGLRVVELTGKPMTPLRCLKRFGGYAAGMATGGLGLVQLLWDSNRQAIQDKTAHTVVIDLRRPPKLPLASVPEASPSPATK